MRSAQGPRRDANESLEGAAERGFGVVSEPGRNLRDRPPPLAQPAAGQVHAPAGEIPRGRHADDVRETLGEPGPREACEPRQRLDGPGFRRSPMKGGQGPAELLVAYPCEPARGFI